MFEGNARLNSPALRGRLRTQVRRSEYERRSVVPRQGKMIADIRPARSSKPQTIPVAPRSAPSIVPANTTTPKQPTLAPRTVRMNRQSLINSTALHTRSTSSKVLKRQGVQVPQSRQGNTRRQPYALFTSRNVYTALALLIIAGGIFIGVQGYNANKEVAAKTTQLLSSGQDSPSTDEHTNNGLPSETPVANIDSYKVAGTLPRIISIDKIGVKARTLRLGVKANNQLAAPANIYDAGWYEASSKAGEAGAMVIDGHVSGPTKPGVFYNLHKLAAGDHIKVENGNGKVHTYKIVKKSTYAADKVDMAAVLTPITPGKPGLNLITCSGEIERATNHYKDRTVVFAEQI